MQKLGAEKSQLEDELVNLQQILAEAKDKLVLQEAQTEKAQTENKQLAQ
jgi:hypothetical protein